MLVLHQDHLPLRKMEVQTDGAVSEAVRKVFNIQGKKKIIHNVVTKPIKEGTTLKIMPTTGKTKTPGNGLRKRECRQ